MGPTGREVSGWAVFYLDFVKKPGDSSCASSVNGTLIILKKIIQGLLRVQGRPATVYDDQGLVFAIAFGGYIRMFDARKYEKVCAS